MLVGAAACAVTALPDASTLECTAPPNYPAPAHVVSLRVSGLGLAPALESPLFTHLATVTSIAPAAGSLAGGTTLTLDGGGLSDAVGDIAVTVGGVPCRLLPSPSQLLFTPCVHSFSSPFTGCSPPASRS